MNFTWTVLVAVLRNYKMAKERREIYLYVNTILLLQQKCRKNSNIDQGGSSRYDEKETKSVHF